MHNKASLGLAIGIIFVSGFAIFSAWAWPWKAALFPLAIGIPLFVLATAEVLWSLARKSAQGDADSARDFQLSTHLSEKEALRRTALAIAWILGFFAAVVLVGFSIAVPLLVFLYMRVQGRERWVFSIVFALVVWACFYGLFDRLLHLPFPDGWIWTWLGLS